MNIKILVVEPNKQPYIKEVKNNITPIYGLVYFPFEILELEENIILISSMGARESNDKCFVANRIYNDKILYSNFVILGKQKEEFTSLSNEQIKKYTDIFKKEVF